MIRYLCAVALGLCCLAAAGAAEPPAILHATLLNGVKLQTSSGRLGLDRLQFLVPDGGPTGGYSPDGADKLWAIVATAAGEELARYDLWADTIKPGVYGLTATRVKLLKDGQAGDAQGVTLGVGDYRLDFYLASGKFYSYSFSVSALGEGGTAPFFLEGDWSNWGYFLYGNNDPNSQLVWKMWLRNKSAKLEQENKLRLELSRDADGKLLATNREGMTFTLNQSWIRYDLDLIEPMKGTSGGAMFLAKDLLAKDGSYTLKVLRNGEPYALWKCAVAGGKFKLSGRADVATADPLTRIWGGDAYWYEATSSSGQSQSTTAAPKPEPVLTMIPDAQPVMVSGVAMLPAKTILNWMQAQVTITGPKVVAELGDRKLEMTAGSKTALVNGAGVSAPAAPVVKDGDLCVPLKFACEALGATTSWDAPTKTLSIIIGNRLGKVRMP